MSALPGKTWLLGILSIMGIIIKSEGLVYRATNTTKGSPMTTGFLLVARSSAVGAAQCPGAGASQSGWPLALLSNIMNRDAA